MEQSMIFHFFGGVSQNGLGWGTDYDKVFYELVSWLLPISICLLAEGVWLEKWKRLEMFTCHRFGTVQIWWRRRFCGGLITGMTTSAVMFLAAVAADAVNAGGVPDEGGSVFVLWSVHMAAILSLLPVMDLAGLRKSALAILLLEGVTFLVGFASVRTARFMFGMWGMYFQSRWYGGERAVPVLPSLIAEGLLILSGYLSGRIVSKRAEWK